MTIETHEWIAYLKKLGFSEMEIEVLFQSAFGTDQCSK